MASVDRELFGKLSVRLNDDGSLNWGSSGGGPPRPPLAPSKLFMLAGFGMLKPGIFGRFMLLLLLLLLLNVLDALLLGG